MYIGDIYIHIKPELLVLGCTSAKVIFFHFSNLPISETSVIQFSLVEGSPGSVSTSFLVAEMYF